MLRYIEKVGTIHILTLAVIVRLFVLFPIFEHPERTIRKDTPSYSIIAENLVDGDGYSMCTSAPYHPDLFRTPGYPLFLAGNYYLFGKQYFSVFCIQFLLDLFICLIVIKIGIRIFNKRAGILAGGLYALNPLSIVLIANATSEILFTFFYTSFLYLLLNSKKETKKAVVTLGILWAIYTLIRPASLLLIFLIPTHILLFWDRVKFISLLYLLPGVLIVGIWICRNYQISGITTISAVQQYNIYTYNANQIIAWKTGEPEYKVRTALRNEINAEIGDDPMDCSDRYEGITLYQERGLEIIKQNIPVFVFLHLKSCLNNFIPPVNEIFNYHNILPKDRNTSSVLNQKGIIAAVEHYFGDKKYLIAFVSPFIIIHLLIIMGWLLGLFHLVKQNKWKFIFAFGIFSLYFLLISGAASVPRFAIPAVPSFVLLAGFYLDHFIRKQVKNHLKH